ncbi:MAG: hypothetical protein LLG02_15390 [Pelosinus sp.]|nr:hypothetical protein [Pelosinus sp.]
MQTIIKHLVTKVLLTGIFALLPFLPITGYALQVDVVGDDGVSARTLTEVRAEIAMVDQFYHDYYGLDIDYPIRLVLASDKEKYITAMMDEFGMTQEEVEKYHYNSDGLTSGRTIVSNLASCPSRGLRLINIAHELTHQYQRSLCGSYNAYELRWLSEGTADVMAYSVLSLNGMFSLNVHNKKCMETLQAVPQIPKLARLGRVQDWVNSANTTGLAVNYLTSDAAVIYLIGKVGYTPMFTYFQLLGDTRDVHQAFAQAFGMNLEDFEEEFNEYLADKGINN